MSVEVLNCLKPYHYYEKAFLILDKSNRVINSTHCRDVFGSIMINSKLGTRVENCIIPLKTETSTSFVISSTLSLEEMQKFFIAIELLVDTKCRHTLISSVNVKGESSIDRERFNRLGLNFFHIDLSPFWFETILNLSNASFLVKIILISGSLIRHLFKSYHRSIDLSISNYIYQVLGDYGVESFYYKNAVFDFNLILDIICNHMKYSSGKTFEKVREDDTYRYFTDNGTVSYIIHCLKHEGNISPDKNHTENLIRMFTEEECQNHISRILDAMNAPVVTQ